MKKLVIIIAMLFLSGLVFAEEASEKAEKESVKTEEIKENAEKAQKELKKEVDPEKAEAEEEAREEAEEAAEEKAEQEAEAAEEKAEQMEEATEEKERTFKAYKPLPVEEYKPVKKEKTKEWHFIPIDISVGTSLQVGLTVAQLTHKNFELRIARFMLGPGFTFGSKVEGSDRDKFVPGLTFLGEVSVGKFFGNPLKESCFGIMLGIGSKIIFDIRNIDDEDRWDDGIYYDDPLYIDFLPLYLTYRHRKGDKFYDFSLRIPLVWQNGVYVVTDETKLYNGVPDITLNFSFVF
jgi:hypothetical protein